MKDSLFSSEPRRASHTTALRDPVAIKPTNTKSPPPRHSQGQRIIIQVTVTSLFITLLAVTLLAATTSGQAETGSGNVFNSVSHLFDSKNDNSTLLAQQAATATAVTQDGFDGGNQSYAGVNGGPILDGTGNHFFQGQCTYWAAFRFHQIHMVWVPWPGNAWEWLGQAQRYGWKVSAQPTVGAILVLQPNVQGAGAYGHVAIVEKINTDHTVYISQYNWQGGFGQLSNWNFSYPNYPRVAFISLP
ncbi:CHAP domain-containing protein [Ktedonobacter robiniae]|uniref:Peptidase C51 domain-containing protein n=1 Tax=Ktedonobacter robiniae TaxID=2778365 RepID=A0ABQ3UHG7_9CHLR|nr:CHAP domain-containing protein [Ktedonobacter robiniae]GHO51865.1 hypothetical protein KSB_03400 [Ktedonobacter robiniae]